MADVLAEAVVELEADVDKFNRDFKRSMRDAEREAKAATDDIDKSFKQLTGDLGKEFRQASKQIEKDYKETQKAIAAENEKARIQYERELNLAHKEALAINKDLENEAKRVAQEATKAQKEFEKEFIASQRAMEKEASESQKRRTEEFQRHVSGLRKLASERFSLTLGVDTSQLNGALKSATKLGAVLGAVGLGALAGHAALAGISQVVLAVQDLAGAIALLPAAGAAAGVVVGTLTLGLRGLGDAIKADKTKDLDEALKNLSENGKKFVFVIRDLKDKFDDLGKSVQQALFSNLEKEVRQLATVLLPILQKGFTGVATELNLAAHQLSAFFKEAQTLKDIQRVFSNTQQSVMVFRRSLIPLAEAFRDITAVGSDFLPVIAADLGGVAKRFAEFIANARQTGTLNIIFENAIQAVRDLFAVIGNIARIFDGVMDAARASLGGGFLAVLKSATQSVEDFVQSSRGQKALIDFFDSAKEAARVILPVLGDLARLILEVVLPAFAKIGTVAAPGLSALVTALRSGLESAIPGIISFVSALSDVVVVLSQSGVLSALGDLVKVLGTSLGSAIRSIAPTLSNLINTILLKLTEILPKILPALAKFADAFGNLVIAAVPVVDVLAEIVSQVGLPTLQRLAEKLTPLITNLARGLSDVLLPVLPDLASAFAEWIDAMAPLTDEILAVLIDLLKVLVPLLPPLIRASAELAVAILPLVKLFAQVADVVGHFVEKMYQIPAVRKFMEEELPSILALLMGTLIIPLTKLLEVLDRVITKLSDLGVFDAFGQSLAVVGNALAIAADAFQRLSDVVVRVFDVMKEVAVFSVDIIAKTISAGFNGIVGMFIAAWESIKSSFSTAWEFLKFVASANVHALVSLVTGGFNNLPPAIQGVIGRLRDIVGEGFNRLLDLVMGLPGRILGALGSLGNLLYGVGQNLVQGFINGITSMVGSLAGQAANMARSALESAKRAIGISSPSKMMLTVGEQFGEGFVIGIENMLRKASEAGAKIASQTVQASTSALAPTDSGMYQLDKALNQLTRNGLGPTPALAAPSATSTPEQTPVVVNPEVYVYIGNEEIDSHITDVVDERDRRTKRSLTMGARRNV